MLPSDDVPTAENRAADSEELSFEEALGRLQRIAARLESGSEGLEGSLQQFEQGVRLLGQCYRRLEQAEQRIELLLKVDAQGEAVTTPFDATATFPGTPVKRRPRKSPSATDPESELPAS